MSRHFTVALVPLVVSLRQQCSASDSFLLQMNWSLTGNGWSLTSNDWSLIGNDWSFHESVHYELDCFFVNVFVINWVFLS